MTEPLFPQPDGVEDIEEGRILAPKFDANGVLPAVVTDAETGDVVMLAYMNDEALARTIATGEGWYWSRSRKALWHKGATSGHVQKVVELRIDCDQDAVWLRVRTKGTGANCHVGYKSCFFRQIPLGGKAGEDGVKLKFAENEKLFDPKEVYGTNDATNTKNRRT